MTLIGEWPFTYLLPFSGQSFCAAQNRPESLCHSLRTLWSLTTNSSRSRIVDVELNEKSIDVEGKSAEDCASHYYFFLLLLLITVSGLPRQNFEYHQTTKVISHVLNRLWRLNNTAWRAIITNNEQSRAVEVFPNLNVPNKIGFLSPLISFYNKFQSQKTLTLSFSHSP